jgi:uncharacterized protein YyaL (SSP411 family)
MQGNAERYPTSFSKWLCEIDFALGPSMQLALMGDPQEPAFQALAGVAFQTYTPRAVIAGGIPSQAQEPELLKSRTTIDGQPTAYLCQNFTCQLPTTAPEKLAEQIAQLRATPAPR